MRAEYNSAVAAGDALLAEAQAEGDVDHEVQARHALWSSSIFRGDLEGTCHQVDRALALDEVDRHGSQALTFGGHDARERALSNSSGALFLLGYPDRALARNAEGIAHARALGICDVMAARRACADFASSLMRRSGKRHRGQLDRDKLDIALT